VLVHALLVPGNECLVDLKEIFYQSMACESCVLISEHVFDICNSNLLLILSIRMPYFGLNVQPIIVIHLSKTVSLFKHIFELFLGVDDLDFTIVVNEIE